MLKNNKTNKSDAKRNETVYRITTALIKVMAFPFFNIKLEGLENLPNNAFVLLPKHQRLIDIPFLGASTPRPLYYIAKHELFINPISNWYLSSLGGIPLNRKRPIKSRRSLYAIINHLHNNEGVVVFPEGTYYLNQMGPGNIGIVRLILSRLSLPFIPVGISYKKGKIITNVHIRYGKPIYSSKEEPPETFLNRLMKEIARLSGLAYLECQPVAKNNS